MTKRKPLRLTKQVNLDGVEVDPAANQDFANKVGAARKSWETGEAYTVKSKVKPSA